MEKNQKLIFTKAELMNRKNRLPMLYDIYAVYEDSKMAEVFVQPSGSESILNNMYVARVQNIVKNLNAAFVEISPGVRGYLPFDEIKEGQPPLFTKKNSKKTIAAGDELVVQVIKEAVRSKDAIVSTNLSFAGEYLALTSGNDQIGISSKLSKAEAGRLKELAQKIVPTDRSYGVIFRTNAAKANENQILMEFNDLKAEYDALIKTAHTRTLYSCLRKEQPLYFKMLRDMDKRKLSEVLTDDPEIYERLNKAMQNENRGYGLRFYEDQMLALAKLYRVKEQIESALKKRVWLKSGANIVIEPTEALTVIDVNSGKNIAGKDRNLYHYKINLEAATEIAWQLRLRNISGIILIDFIDLCDSEQNAKLLEEFRKYLKQDSIPVKLVDMTKLGLVELTRKKQKKSLAEQLGCYEN